MKDKDVKFCIECGEELEFDDIDSLCKKCFKDFDKDDLVIDDDKEIDDSIELFEDNEENQFIDPEEIEEGEDW